MPLGHRKASLTGVLLRRNQDPELVFQVWFGRRSLRRLT